MVVVMLLRRIAYNMLALFRTVTQRSEERRQTPWRDIVRWLYQAVIAATDEDVGRAPCPGGVCRRVLSQPGSAPARQEGHGRTEAARAAARKPGAQAPGAPEPRAKFAAPGLPQLRSGWPLRGTATPDPTWHRRCAR